MEIVRDAAPGIHQVTDAYTNWFLVEDGARVTVVDAGVPASWRSLHAAAPELGLDVSDVEAIVLTHAHFDHLGFAERARRELGVDVWVHANDAPLTRHPLQYTHERARSYYFVTKPRALPIVAALTARRAWWPRAVQEVRRYEGGTLDVPGKPSVVPTPGHTVGHCALYFPERDCVIAGDAVVTLDPYTGSTGPRLVARGATADSTRALQSLDRLAETGAGTVLVGHGPAWTAGAADAVERARAAGVA